MNTLNDSMLRDLVAAVTEKDTEGIRRLLALGVEPDRFDVVSGWSALHAAVAHFPKALTLLLRCTRDPDLPRVCGITPLASSVVELGEKPDPHRTKELILAIRLLLESGADPAGGGHDHSPLPLARRYDLPGIVEIFLEHTRPKP